MAPTGGGSEAEADQHAGLRGAACPVETNCPVACRNVTQLRAGTQPSCVQERHCRPATCYLTSVTYISRFIDSHLSALVEDAPAVMVVGPRACGKTTTGRRLAASTLHVDHPDNRTLLSVNPDSVLAAKSEPVLVDEWQACPKVLGGVKRLVDADPRPGRFILTGSLAAELTSAGWPMAGQVTRLAMWGLTEREIAGQTAQRSLLEVLLAQEFDAIALPPDPPDLTGYLEIALRGMLPEAVRRKSAASREALYESYIDQAVNHDLSVISERRDPRLLRAYLKAVAANTAGTPQHSTLYNAVGIARASAVAYDGVLESIFLTERVPSWAHNRLDRLVRTPKRYLTDPGLLGPLLDVNAHSLQRNSDLLGRTIDTLVRAQIRPELAFGATRLDAYHLRTGSGRREVDLLLATRDDRVIACEVKAAGSPSTADAAHLVWLREELGPDFLAGVVFHTGTHIYRMDERIYALPIATLWSTHAGA